MGIEQGNYAKIETVTPATEEKQNEIIAAIENKEFSQLDSIATEETQTKYGEKLLDKLDSIRQEETGEIYTIDEGLQAVFGTEKLVTNRKLNVNPIPEYSVYRKNLPLITNATVLFDVTGYSSLAIQVLGTWTGTLTFEGSVNGGDFIALNGIAVNGTTIISTATANGIYRFNVAGLTKVSVRFSTATTGSPQLLFVASPEATTLISNTITANTTDSILPSSYTPQAGAPRIIPVAPATPTSGISNFLTKFPQIFNRLRVESGGSMRVPFAQEEETSKMLTSDLKIRNLLEEILVELRVMNNMKMQELDSEGKKIQYPKDIRDVDNK